jgi:hypothetical protein
LVFIASAKWSAGHSRQLDLHTLNSYVPLTAQEGEITAKILEEFPERNDRCSIQRKKTPVDAPGRGRAVPSSPMSRLCVLEWSV